MYGLYYKIVSLGYLCEVIDYRCPAIEQRERLDAVRFSLKPKELFINKFVRPKQRQKVKKLNEFVNDHVCLSTPYSPETINEAKDRYDKIICGSDIIWGRDITKDDYNYFLEFAGTRTKRFAFASSVGDCKIRPDEKRLKNNLMNFTRIAVRELDAVDWVKKVSGIKADWVCDPTMLLTTQEWNSIITPSAIQGDYVLIYFDDDKHKCSKDAQKYAQKYGLKVKRINYGFPKKGVSNVRPTTLEEFLGLIKCAKAVFTSSYHGLLFSIYYHREVMFYSRAHSSRVISLGQRLNIMSHCGDSIDPLKVKPMNFVCIDDKVKEFRDQSCEILGEMLSE